MNACAEDGIPNVVKVSSLDFVHQHAVFVLTAVSEHAIFAYDNIPAYISTWLEDGSGSDIAGPVDHRGGRELHRGVDKHLARDMHALRDLKVELFREIEVFQGYFDC